MAFTALPPVGTYTLDPATTSIGLSMRAMWGVVPVRASFALRYGTVTVTSPTSASVEVVADTASFASGIAKRDEHVKSADFLDVARHPELTFAGSGGTDDLGVLHLRGTLTALASTPLDLTIADLVMDADGQGFVASATGVLTRESAGITVKTGKVGSQIRVSITTHARLGGAS